MTQSRLAPLSNNEEVTLRRVAFGQSDVACLRAQDLERLRTLRLIEGSAREPTLTADGKRHFDALPKAAARTEFKAHDDLLAAMAKRLARPARR